ncbi:MAG: single-stranded-DNA-specific exonuclease RecJ, partial [Bacillota bacterium]
MEKLKREGGLLHLAAVTLASRGVTGAEQMRRLLSRDLDDLADPFELPDASRAVERVRDALSRGEKIRIYGDYDCDGITSTALMLSVLRGMGGDVDFRLPHRLRDGYGLGAAAVEEAAGDGVQLLITVDCGIGSRDEVAAAREVGLDVIVTDHHRPPDVLPPAAAIVDPWVDDSTYPYSHLAGVGVCYQLCRAVSGDDLSKLLDLAALGTVADMVPLTGENRILVAAGLEQLRRAPRQGIISLAARAGLDLSTVTERDLAFTLAPRINAPGRLGDAAPLVEMLLTSEGKRAEELAATCECVNEVRRAMLDETVARAQLRLETGVESLDRGCLVLWDETWHPGILGLVASRLVEQYRRPAVVLAPDPEEPSLLRGSGRSLSGLSLLGALKCCEDLLEGFGGHDLAAGMSVRRDRLEEFARRMDAAVRPGISPEIVLPRLRVAGEIPLRQVHARSVQQLEELGPFGREHPRPLFLSRDVQVRRARPVGKSGRHLMLELDSAAFRVVGFNMAGEWVRASAPRRIDMVYAPRIDRWRGRERVQLVLRAFRPAGGGTEEMVLAALRRRWGLLRELYPEEQTLRRVYDHLTASAARDEVAATEEEGERPPFSQAGRVLEGLQEEIPGLNLTGLLCALDILAELNL